jgi:hypothetical protein
MAEETTVQGSASVDAVTPRERQAFIECSACRMKQMSTRSDPARILASQHVEEVRGERVFLGRDEVQPVENQ